MDQRWLFTFLLPRSLAEGEEEFLLLRLKTVSLMGIPLAKESAMNAAGSSGDVKGSVFHQVFF